MQIELSVFASLHLERGPIQLACLACHEFILFVVKHESEQGLSSSTFCFCRSHIGVIRCGSWLLHHSRFGRSLILGLSLYLRCFLFKRTIGSVLRLFQGGRHDLLLLTRYSVCIIVRVSRFSITGCSLRVDL